MSIYVRSLRASREMDKPGEVLSCGDAGISCPKCGGEVGSGGQLQSTRSCATSALDP